jgi:hypothetical protein
VPPAVVVPPQHPNGAHPPVEAWSGRISDWGFRSGEADGPFAGSWLHQYSWWNDSCQRRFDDLWTDEAEGKADDLADRYLFYWPWLIGKALVTSAPETYERILGLRRASTTGSRLTGFRTSASPGGRAIPSSIRRVRNARTGSFLMAPMSNALGRLKTRITRRRSR